MSDWAGSTATINGHAAGEAESPFLGERPIEEAYAQEWERDVAGQADAGETPFVSDEASQAGAGALGDLHELLEDLYDSEFDHALLELSEAAAESAAASALTQGEVASPPGERYVREWLEPLRREGEEMVDRIAESLSGHDLTQMPTRVLEELLDEHEPVATGANPEFENFLGGVFNKIKGVVSGAVNLAKKGIAAVGRLLPIGAILNRLKALVRPLLERVLQMALNRLPPALRPAAEALKRRLLGEAEAYEDEDEAEAFEDEAPHGVPTTADVGEVQREFDVHAASLLLAADEAAQDAVVGEAFAATAEAEDPINELAAARERFEEELRALPPGGDPQPAVEQFLPAVMAVLPLVRMGISLVGRDRILRAIAGFVSPIIRPYVGEQAAALSQAIASTGLGMMSLEAPLDPHEVGASVLSGTVEDTVRHVGEESAEALEHPQLLGAAVARAFDRAAAGRFPPVLLKPGHRPVHLPAGAVRDHRSPVPATAAGMWVRVPGVHAYLRYTRPLTAHITPTIARQVRLFGGMTLDSLLRDRYGITDAIDAPVHLYEAQAGATLGRIAAHERRVPGLGHPRASWKLLPLTPEAAGLLLGEPGLGRAVAPEYLISPARIAVGQRFFVLEVRRRHAAPAAGSTQAIGIAPVAPVVHGGRSSQVDVRVDERRHTVRVAMYLSEARAQKIAALVRSGGPSAAARPLLDRLRRGLDLALSPTPHGRLHVVPDGVGVAVPRVPHGLRRRLPAQTERALVDWLARNAAAFTAAADRRADGVTVIVELRGVAFGRRAGAQPPASAVEVVAGRRRA